VPVLKDSDRGFLIFNTNRYAHHASQTVPPSKALARHTLRSGWLRGRRWMDLGATAQFWGKGAYSIGDGTAGDRHEWLSGLCGTTSWSHGRQSAWPARAFAVVCHAFHLLLDGALRLRSTLRALVHKLLQRRARLERPTCLDAHLNLAAGADRHRLCFLWHCRRLSGPVRSPRADMWVAFPFSSTATDLR
jgi:hypothetical protein